MFPRRRAVATCLALSFLGLSALFLHAESIAPRALSISQIGGGDVGTLVRVYGHIHRAWTTDEGNAAFLVMDYEDFATIRVVARPRAVAQPTLASPGALVEVVGAVFDSGRVLQIFAEESGGVTVRDPASTNLLPIEFVARNAARLEGQRVLVRAAIADLRTIVDFRHALLRAGDAEVWAYAVDGWSEGRADVTGRAFVTSRGRCELFVGPEPHPREATVAALATCPEALSGQPVLLRNVLVTPGELIGTALTLRDPGDGAEYRLAAFVRGWDWRQEAPPIRLGGLCAVEGVLEYHATEARWRVATDLRPRA